MKYLLSEEEYSELNNIRVEEVKKLEATVNRLCIDVANYKPTFYGWDKDQEPTPWRCGYKEVNNFVTAKHHYCDECSVQGICTMSKNWSK